MEPYKNIENLIIQGRIPDALKELRDLSENSRILYEEVIQTSARFQAIERDRLMGVVETSLFLVERNQIVSAMLSILEKVKLHRDTHDPVNRITQLSYSRDFKTYGPFVTKMIPIFPYLSEHPLKIENIIFDYYPDNIYSSRHFPDFYGEITDYVSRKSTIYNEAKPHLMDYNITFSEEDQAHYLELELGVCGYLDFLSVSRNLDVERSDGTTFRDALKISNSDKSPTHPANHTPKQLGVSSILITEDNYLVFQKRQKSEIASKMYHVSVAEGLQAYPSYQKYTEMAESERLFHLVDKDLLLAAYRGMDEELGIEENDVRNIEFLSMYFDYELQQPIFQTLTYLDIDSGKLKDYYDRMKGRDTLAEVGRLDFVANKIDDFLQYFKQTNLDGRWSSHAVINIISFLERHFGSDKKLAKKMAKYFNDPIEFYLGEQRYVEGIKKR